MHDADTAGPSDLPAGSSDLPAEMETELEPYADSLPHVPRDPQPEPGDPPATVRGTIQGIVDPPGDAADDGSRRWDPRTARTDQREGG